MRATSRVIRPQKGPQEKFLATSADIAIYGGAAGGGKTYGLLMEPLRYINVRGYRAVIFRKNYTQINASGGLWDESTSMYSGISGALAVKTPKPHWNFGGNAILYFDYLGRDDDLKRWQGSQITFIGFDELTHFSERQFFYMMSRNRSMCGVKPYIRATCNPDADSWVAKFISWWIDQDTGYPIRERSGQKRLMARVNNQIIWGDTKKELLLAGVEESSIKSVTFIASTLQDNKILMEKNPSYLSNLKAMTEVDMERLLYGNWKIKAQAGRYFKRTQVTLIAEAPKDIIMWCRAWDLAATDEDENGDADLTAGVLMGLRKDGTIVVLNVINQRIKAGEVERLVYNTSVVDRQRYGFQYVVRVPQDPGQAGKVLAGQYVKLLSGFNIKTLPVSGSKELRATPFAAQWQNGNVEVLLGDWNDEYFSQLESFPESKHDDMVDASSDAFSELTERPFDIDALL